MCPPLRVLAYLKTLTSADSLLEVILYILNTYERNVSIISFKSFTTKQTVVHSIFTVLRIFQRGMTSGKGNFQWEGGWGEGGEVGGGL